MHEETDTQLVGRMRSGDPAAYEALFLRHYGRVYRASYALARSHDLADDAAQDAFLMLYRRPPALDGAEALLAWLCRVAINRTLNMLRGERREQARAVRAADVDQAQPLDALLAEEERALVRAALASLPERQARMLALRAAGLSYAAIAAELALAPGSIGTLLARAERALIQSYTALERTPPERPYVEKVT